MKKNMGNADRLIRIVLAAVFGVLYFADIVNGAFAWVLLAAGGVFLVTSIVGFCPLYTAAGISTRGHQVM
ncbi:YgaP family membrane protein [Chitinophagaceae bacterium MMS25-I14]